jgi:hypothetical protein
MDSYGSRVLIPMTGVLLESTDEEEIKSFSPGYR